MAKITEIEGIGPAYAEKLIGVGIKTVETLREIGKTKKGRQELAQKTGLPEKNILGWVNRADLFRVRGIGEQYSELLELAGVDTVVELGKRIPANLHKKMLEVNTEKKLVRQLPTEKQVSSWVEQAKLLPRLVEY
jgi:predicted flap endonuclease-1-like 5' DNA nuclease